MTIQYCSDLHLEFPENNAFIKSNPLHEKGDILVLAGDIIPFVVMNKHNDFFDFIADNFETTYWIPGNHEYYYEDAAKRSGSFIEKIRSNIFLLNNEVVRLNDIQLIFTTLWSHISPVNHWEIQQNISDFHAIKFNNISFNPTHFNQLHQDSVEFLNKAFAESYDGKTVVVSHHVPTFMSYPEKYKRSKVSEAFTVEMYNLIEVAQPDYWIYGHHHVNVPAFEIGKTQLVTNQLGYISQKENAGFSSEVFINI